MPDKEFENAWPTICELYQKSHIGLLDIEMAKTSLNVFKEPTEAMALAICHLSLAEKSGHLLIERQEEKINPPFITLIEDEGSFNEIDQKSSIGLLELEAAFKCLSTEEQENALISVNNCKVYFKKSWHEEREIVAQIKKLLKESPQAIINETIFETQIQEKLSLKLIDETQALAIKSIICGSLGFLIGGPGTGKTYTAAHALDCFFKALDLKEAKNFECAIAAPTGKAASHFYSGLKRIVKDKWIEDAKCTTLHALLYRSAKDELKEGYLSKDLILVDEASMIDASLMLKLFKALKKGARLILIGDKHQLPPVDAGSLFADLIESFLKNGQNFLAELKTAKRQENSALSELSEAILASDYAKTVAALEKKECGIEFINWEDKQLKASLIKETLLNRFKFLQEVEKIEDLFAHLKKFCILTPRKNGFYGTHHLNSLYLQELQKSEFDCLTLPIIITKNKPSLNLYNGEIGFLRCSNLMDLKKGDAAYFQINGEIKKIPAILLPNFDLSFSFTIHKSQGSEFENVLVLFGPEGICFGKEILYTAISRAKKNLTLFSTYETINSCLKLSGRRVSGIKDNLEPLFDHRPLQLSSPTQ